MEGYSENIVKLGGIVASELEFSHELYGEKFYKFYIETQRLSQMKDEIPVIISERLIDLSNFKIGTKILVEGQYRSYNQLTEDGKRKLVLSVFVKDIIAENMLEDNEEQKIDMAINNLVLVGSICKTPIYRKTPLGREIADVLIAVNRAYNKSDYIPCILWGRNAKFCSTLPIGTCVRLEGRIQSRSYDKKDETGAVTKHIAYEVSVSKFENVICEDVE